MTSRRDELDRTRWRTTLGFLVGFVVWWVLTIIERHLPRDVVPRGWTVGLLFAALLGWIIWVVFQWRGLREYSEIRKDPELRDALDDEYTRHVRDRSWVVGFWCLLVTQGGLLVAASFWEFSALLAAQIGVLVGVAAPLTTYLVLDRA